QTEQEHGAHDRDEPIPRGHRRQGPAGMGRLVQRLERRRAPDALVDSAAQRSEIVGQAPPIPTAEPARPPEEVAPRRPLLLQQRFRLSIPALLLPILSTVAATMFP